jgi:hypothetical protein
LRDALVTPDPNGDQLPTVARQTGFTRQDPNGTGGYSGTTTTPTPTFTHRPCTGYAGGGTCDGGAAMMPPEVIMLDYASTVVSTALDRPTFTSGVLVSIVYDVKAPGTNYACGIPCLATGGISSGYSWRVKNGALSFSYHDSTGAKDEAMHFTTTQRIG